MKRNEPTKGAPVDQLSVSRLKPGDCFAYDGPSYVDGDIIYVEILESIRRFPRDVDRVGKAAGGYRVAVYSSDEPQPAEDHYATDFVEAIGVRLNAEEMRRARYAGWPSSYAHFRDVFGNELALPAFRVVRRRPRPR